MNNRTLSTICYILIVFVMISILFKILPYVILGGIIAYIIFKCYAFIKGKTLNKKHNNDNYSETSTYEPTYTKEDVDVSEAIDVDFKEVK